MKKILLTGLSLLCGGVLFSSFEYNVTNSAGNCTGSNGSTGTCSSVNCHFSSGINDLNLSIIVSDASNGNVVTSYVPDEYYKITLKGTHGAGGVFAAYGLQFTTGQAVDGAFTLFGNSLKSQVIAPYQYIEHRAPIAPVNNGCEVYFQWKAPPAGTGDITFYCTMLAANGDHFVNGDIDKNTSLTLLEGATSVADIDAITNIALYPNPAKDNMTLMMETTVYGDYSYSIYNLSGQKMLSKTGNIQMGKTNESFDVASLNAGMYIMEISKDGHSKVLPFMKE